MPRFRPLAVTFLVCTLVTATRADTHTVDLGLATLEELMAVCSYCKRIRADQNYWERVEVYVSEHTDAKFTHGICPPRLEIAKAEFDRDEATTETPRGRL